MHQTNFQVIRNNILFFLELGDHLEMYVDPVTGKMYLGERRNPGMEVFVDPETGITYVRTADGKKVDSFL